MPRIPRWSSLPSTDLWLAWRAQYESNASAVAGAIVVANRLGKSSSVPLRRRFYAAKDVWLMRNQASLVKGAIARQEAAPCGVCRGKSAQCWRCQGAGEHSPRTLYLHRLQIEDCAYALHSYCPPCRIDGADGGANAYGKPYTEDEITALPLPPTGMAVLLDHVAAMQWGLQYQASGQEYR